MNPDSVLGAKGGAACEDSIVFHSCLVHSENNKLLLEKSIKSQKVIFNHIFAGEERASDALPLA